MVNNDSAFIKLNGGRAAYSNLMKSIPFGYVIETLLSPSL